MTLKKTEQTARGLPEVLSVPRPDCAVNSNPMNSPIPLIPLIPIANILPRATAPQPFTFIDLFAGIGGIHLGFHQAGARCVFASEWNVHARKTYEENISLIEPDLFKNKQFAGDITKVVLSDIPDFTVLTGGFPCQSFSHAGKRKGFEDARGTLFFNLAQILKEKRPEAFFFENVRGLLNHDQGKTFKVIQDTITAELGYSFFFKVIRASDFGLPQHRPRVYMVGFKDPTLPFHFPAPIPLTLTMTDIFGAPCPKKIGYTLRVGGRKSTINDRRNWDGYLVNGQVQYLSATEGKKMQGFPDSYVFSCSETQSMKQLGNSVAVSVIEAIAKEIKATLENAGLIRIQP